MWGFTQLQQRIHEDAAEIVGKVQAVVAQIRGQQSKIRSIATDRRRKTEYRNREQIERERLGSDISETAHRNNSRPLTKTRIIWGNMYNRIKPLRSWHIAAFWRNLNYRYAPLPSWAETRYGGKAAIVVIVRK